MDNNTEQTKKEALFNKKQRNGQQHRTDKERSTFGFHKYGIAYVINKYHRLSVQLSESFRTTTKSVQAKHSNKGSKGLH